MASRKIYIFIIILIQLTLLGWWYFTGPHSYYVICSLQKEVKALEKEMVNLACNRERLERDIVDWQNSDFYKQVYVREKLQYKNPLDTIYLRSFVNMC